MSSDRGRLGRRPLLPRHAELDVALVMNNYAPDPKLVDLPGSAAQVEESPDPHLVAEVLRLIGDPGNLLPGEHVGGAALSPSAPSGEGLSTVFIGPVSGSSLNPARTVAPAVLPGVYTDIWVYLIAIPIALAWKPRSADTLDRGPGRANDLS